MADLTELTRRFRAFSHSARSRAPLYSTLAEVVADDPTLVGLLQEAPNEQHNPVLLFVAVHDLVLRGLGPDLASFYPNLATVAKVGDVGSAFRAFVSDHRESIRELVATRNTQTNEVARCALFLPPLARLDAECGPLALVEIGASAGLNLLLTHYSYEYQPGGLVGETSPVHITCGTRGHPPIPVSLPVSLRQSVSTGRRSTSTTPTRRDGCWRARGPINSTDSLASGRASRWLSTTRLWSLLAMRSTMC